MFISLELFKNILNSENNWIVIQIENVADKKKKRYD